MKETTMATGYVWVVVDTVKPQAVCQNITVYTCPLLAAEHVMEYAWRAVLEAVAPRHGSANMDASLYKAYMLGFDAVRALAELKTRIEVAKMNDENLRSVIALEDLQILLIAVNQTVAETNNAFTNFRVNIFQRQLNEGFTAQT